MHSFFVRGIAQSLHYIFSGDCLFFRVAVENREAAEK